MNLDTENINNNNDHSFSNYNYEDEEPIYSFPDDDNGDSSDEEPLYDYDEDENEDDDDDDEDDDDQKEKHPSAFGILIKTLLTPVEGWKALKRAKFTTEHFANHCFIPSVCLATFSQIIKVFYEANLTFTEIFLDSLCTFLVYFFGYFSIIFIGSFALPRLSRPLVRKDIGKQFVMLNLSTLALFSTLIQIVPMLDPVLVFLPIWTIYLIYKGIRVIRVPADVENSTTGILTLLILGLPIFWNWILKELLLPSAGA